MSIAIEATRYFVLVNNLKQRAEFETLPDNQVRYREYSIWGVKIIDAILPVAEARWRYQDLLNKGWEAF